MIYWKPNTFRSLILGGLLFSSTLCDAATRKIAHNPQLPEFIRITNRAQCAIDAALPARSAFLVFDSFNAGKLGHNLGVLLNSGHLKLESPAEVAELAMEEFRLANYRLMNTILTRLASGELPILVSQLPNSALPSDSISLTKFQTIMKDCSGQPYCREMNEYLAIVWETQSGISAGLKYSSRSLLSLDNFKQNHFNNTLVNPPSCILLKKFSPLQAQLHQSNLNTTILEEIARAYLQKDNYVTSCEKNSIEIGNRHGAMQFDLSVTDPQVWNSIGFDYWHSVKLYWSWAWRHAREMSQFAPRFHHLFRSLALEDSIMLIPNSCQSITKPQCESETLAINSIRELAKTDGKPTEHSRDYPQSPAALLLERGVRSVNDDFLGTRSSKSTASWVKNLRDNYVTQRGRAKNRFHNAILTTQLISNSIGPIELAALNDSNSRLTPTRELIDELYYFCTELRLAGDKRLDFLKSDIENLDQLNKILILSEVNRADIKSTLTYFSTYVTHAIPVCDRLEKENYWDNPDHTVSKSGFNAWAREILQVTTPYNPEQQVKSPIFGSPLLVWRNREAGVENHILCANSYHCGRLLLKSLVDLYSVAIYAEAFLPVSSTVLSPNIFNPYSELTACKVYDPWYQTNRTQKRLLADLANTAIFGFTALPIFIDTNWSYPRVTSFNKLVEEGVIKFAPNINRVKLQTALVADLGPLVGAPCAVAIAPTPELGLRYYAFTGISLNYCNSTSNLAGQVDRPNRIIPEEGATRSVCGGCSLNFISVPSAASGFLEATPLKGFIYLFRAIYNFATGMRDPHNIPRETNINVQYLLDTFKENGNQIPPNCVNQLGEGLRCYQNLCAARAANYFEKLTGERPKHVFLQNDQESSDLEPSHNTSFTAWIKTERCESEIAVNIICDERAQYFYAAPKGRWGMRERCRGLL